MFFCMHPHRCIIESTVLTSAFAVCILIGALLSPLSSPPPLLSASSSPPPLLSTARPSPCTTTAMYSRRPSRTLGASGRWRRCSSGRQHWPTNVGWVRSRGTGRGGRRRGRGGGGGGGGGKGSAAHVMKASASVGPWIIWLIDPLSLFPAVTLSRVQVLHQARPDGDAMGPYVWTSASCHPPSTTHHPATLAHCRSGTERILLLQRCCFSVATAHM